MATDHILALLLIERDKLTTAIEALQGPVTTDKTPGPGRKAAPPFVEQDSKPQLAVDPTLNRNLKSPAHVDSDALTILYEDADTLIRQLDTRLIVLRALQFRLAPSLLGFMTMKCGFAERSKKPITSKAAVSVRIHAG
jgi:hypothetical protein